MDRVVKTCIHNISTAKIFCIVFENIKQDIIKSAVRWTVKVYCTKKGVGYSQLCKSMWYQWSFALPRAAAVKL